MEGAAAAALGDAVGDAAGTASPPESGKGSSGTSSRKRKGPKDQQLSTAGMITLSPSRLKSMAAAKVAQVIHA